MSTTTHPLAERIAEISPMLRKFAAHRTGTAYSHDLASMSTEAQDLYQVAVEEILTHCSPEDTKSYMLNLANWRMQNASKREGNLAARLIEDQETGDEDQDGLLEMLADETTSDPETRLIENEIAARVQEICRTLKPEQATVVRLLRDGFSVQEIANKLGITDRAVRFRIESIRTNLAPALVMA